MATKTHPNDWIAEEEIAKQLGVDREKIRAVRPQLLPGEFRQQGKIIVWLRSAADRVADQLGLELHEKTPPTAPPVQANGNPAVPEKNPPTNQTEEVTVLSTPGPGGWHFANHNLIRARRSNGEAIIVRVVDSRKYLPKMRNGQPMTLKAVAAESGLWWRPIGREPRYPGVW